MLTQQQIQDNKTTYLELCRKNITRPGLEKFLNWLEGSDFFSAPSSSRFHGNYAGGLCEHSLNVYKALQGLYEGVNKLANTPSYSLETLTITSLFHDVCKVNFYKLGTRNQKNKDGRWEAVPWYEIDEKIPLGHGEKSCILLQQFFTLTIDELLAIRWHMGGFDTAVKGGDYALSKAQDVCKLVPLLHIADSIAASLMEYTDNPQ